jgi:hypothetical protein
LEIWSLQLEKDWNCFVQKISQDKEAASFKSFEFVPFGSAQLVIFAQIFEQLSIPLIPAFSPVRIPAVFKLWKLITKRISISNGICFFIVR